MKSFTTVFLLSFIICTVSCKKSNREFTFMIPEANSSGITAFVTCIENGNKTNFEIVITNTKTDSSYDVRFHQGPPNSFSSYAPYNFTNIKATSNMARLNTQIDLKYDDFANFDGTCVVYPSGSAYILAKGGIGKNGG